jgi:hypothetical protein
LHSGTSVIANGEASCLGYVFSIHFIIFSFFSQYFLLTSTMYLQKFSEEELAEMPSCNLAETIHNK